FFLKKIFFGGRHWQTYMVKTGDNLPQIAYQSKVSLKRLAKVNKIAKPFIIGPGQKILVPPTLFKGKSDMVKPKALVRGKSK
ncbi:MAG TPA: LysM domain-containing protein, partial [Patescibacteria group bacterium]|nr:LysM domain-containing protein [Patescibacteria group bacterium]